MTNRKIHKINEMSEYALRPPNNILNSEYLLIKHPVKKNGYSLSLIPQLFQ